MHLLNCSFVIQEPTLYKLVKNDGSKIIKLYVFQHIKTCLKFLMCWSELDMCVYSRGQCEFPPVGREEKEEALCRLMFMTYEEVPRCTEAVASRFSVVLLRFYGYFCKWARLVYTISGVEDERGTFIFVILRFCDSQWAGKHVWSVHNNSSRWFWCYTGTDNFELFSWKLWS